MPERPSGPQKFRTAGPAPTDLIDLVDKVVHDVRGPLGAIMGFIGLMKKEKDLSAEAREDCELMLKEIARISAMLEQLLATVKSRK